MCRHSRQSPVTWTWSSSSSHWSNCQYHKSHEWEYHDPSGLKLWFLQLPCEWHLHEIAGNWLGVCPVCISWNTAPAGPANHASWMFKVLFNHPWYQPASSFCNTCRQLSLSKTIAQVVVAQQLGLSAQYENGYSGCDWVSTVLCLSLQVKPAYALVV